MTTSSLRDPFIAEERTHQPTRSQRVQLKWDFESSQGIQGDQFHSVLTCHHVLQQLSAGAQIFEGGWSASKWLDGASGGLRNKSFKCMDFRRGKGQAGNTGDNGNTPQNKCRAVKFLQPPKKAVDADFALKWGGSGKWDMCVVLGPGLGPSTATGLLLSSPVPTLALVSNAKTGCGNAGGSARGLKRWRSKPVKRPDKSALHTHTHTHRVKRRQSQTETEEETKGNEWEGDWVLEDRRTVEWFFDYHLHA